MADIADDEARVRARARARPGRAVSEPPTQATQSQIVVATPMQEIVVATPEEDILE